MRRRTQSYNYSGSPKLSSTTSNQSFERLTPPTRPLPEIFDSLPGAANAWKLRMKWAAEMGFRNIAN
jgi:hypothetical protein